jgi:hypothetical protein
MPQTNKAAASNRIKTRLRREKEMRFSIIMGSMEYVDE